MARKLSRRKRRYIAKYQKQERKRLREATGAYCDKWIEDTINRNVQIWLEEKASTRVINQHWRRMIRANRDWIWLNQNDVNILPGSRRQNCHRYILCVFHEERTPSLWLHRDGGYHCFGCQASGDIVDLAIHLHKLKTVRDIKQFFKLGESAPKELPGSSSTAF